jgi:hypothetical protein
LGIWKRTEISSVQSYSKRSCLYNWHCPLLRVMWSSGFTPGMMPHARSSRLIFASHAVDGQSGCNGIHPQHTRGMISVPIPRYHTLVYQTNSSCAWIYTFLYKVTLTQITDLAACGLGCDTVYEGVSKSFRTESITKHSLISNIKGYGGKTH